MLTAWLSAELTVRIAPSIPAVSVSPLSWPLRRRLVVRRRLVLELSAQLAEAGRPCVLTERRAEPPGSSPLATGFQLQLISGGGSGGTH